MKYKEYFIEGKDQTSSCVIRSFSKVLNREYDEIQKDLNKIAKELNCESFNEIPVFEKYMEMNNIFKIDSREDILVKNLKLDEGIYMVLCYDKKDYYHMIPIIDNVVYDKTINCMDLYVITVYKQNE